MDVGVRVRARLYGEVGRAFVRGRIEPYVDSCVCQPAGVWLTEKCMDSRGLCTIKQKGPSLVVIVHHRPFLAEVLYSPPRSNNSSGGLIYNPGVL